MHPWVLGWVRGYGYPALFFGLALEGTGLPGPVELLFLGAGVLVHEGRLDVLGIIMVTAIGNLVGNLGGYAMGAWGGRPLVLRFGRHLGINEGALAQIAVWFDRYGGRTVAVSRLIGVTRTPAIWASGLVGMGLWVYAGWAFLGDLVWATIWTYLGVTFGLEWPRAYAHYRFALDVLALAIIALLVGLWNRRRRKEDSLAR